MGWAAGFAVATVIAIFAFDAPLARWLDQWEPAALWGQVLAVLEPAHAGQEPASLVRLDAAHRRVEQIVARRLAGRPSLAPLLARLGWASICDPDSAR